MPRIPDDVRDAILNDIRAGKPRNQTARNHGVSVGTVTNIANRAGLTDAFDRSATEKATRARIIDCRALREQLKLDLLGDAQRLRKRAWSKYQVAVGTGEGTEIVTLELPPLMDVRAAYTSIGICVDKSIAVERHDTDSGVDQARSMLAGLSDALGAAARALDGADGPAAGD